MSSTARGRRFWFMFFLALGANVFVCSSRADDQSNLQQHIQDVATSLAKQGFRYEEGQTPIDITAQFQDSKPSAPDSILKSDALPKASDCLHFSFSVFFTVLDDGKIWSNVKKADAEAVMSTWCTVTNYTRDTGTVGLVSAATQHIGGATLGATVPIDHMAPGDLVFFWRTSTPNRGPGQSGVILEVLKDSKNKIFGVKYAGARAYDGSGEFSEYWDQPSVGDNPVAASDVDIKPGQVYAVHLDAKLVPPPPAPTTAPVAPPAGPK
jgi:hypothetical protein